MNLRIPGPTPLPPQVAAAMSRPMINHRGPVFAELQKSIITRLKQVLETENDVIIYPSSGTGGMEAALANVLSPGDRVLACVAGMFGQRFAEMAERFGAQVDRLTFPMGAGVEPTALAEKLRAAPDTRVVLITHSETSSGVLHPLEKLAKAVHENSNALVVVDAISSVGATRLATDPWGCDIVITGTQKALMGPPGASIVTISQHAWHAYETARSPRYYWDWHEWKKSIAIGQTPITPALPVYFAMDVALDMIRAEGLDAVFARHARCGKLMRSRAQALGFTLAADEHYASPTVTTLYPPQGVEAGPLIARMRDELGVEVAGGLGEWKGKIIRVGHLGHVHESDMLQALDAMKQAVSQQIALTSTQPSERSQV